MLLLEFAGVGVGGFFEVLQALFVAEDVDGLFGHGGYVAYVAEVAGFAVYVDLGEAAGIGGDDGHGAGHGFEGREAEALGLGGEQEEVGDAEYLADLLLLAEEAYIVVHAEGAGELFHLQAVGAVAYHQQLAGHGLFYAGEDVYHIGHALHAAEVGYVHEYLLAIGREHLLEVVLIGMVKALYVYEVGDDEDVLFYLERAKGFLAQVLGYGGDSVALVDGEGDDGGIGGVAAHEGDVGAVEGGDEWYVLAGLLEYLPGKVGGRGVGYGVVQVQHVELLVHYDIDHGACQGGLVGGEVEQGVCGHLYFVEVDIGVEALAEPHGLLVGDEVYFVAFIGKGKAQLGSQHAAAAKGGITYYTYFHLISKRSKNKSRKIPISKFQLCEST